MEKYIKKDLIGLGSSGNRVYKVTSIEDKVNQLLIKILENVRNEKSIYKIQLRK